MFRSQLKTAFRNFWKNRRYSLVNVIGLALSLTCFILVVLYVQNQYSYDRWNPLADRVYQVNINYGASDLATGLALKAKGEQPKSADIGTTTPAGLAPLLKDKIPEVQAVNRISMAEWKQGLFTLSDNDQQYIKNIIGVDSAFFRVFPYRFRYGNADHALDGPHDMVLSYETAKKLFGDQNPVGRSVQLDHNEYYTITGVMDKPTTPSSMSIGALFKAQNTNQPWGYKWYFTYVLLRPGTSDDAVARKMEEVLYHSPAAKEVFGDKTAQILLSPLTSLYLHPATDNQPGAVGNPQTLSILLLMAFLILVVSCVNFTNLSVAQATSRAREVGVKKVLGSTRAALSLQFLGETFLQCLLGIFIALVLAEWLLPAVNRELGTSLALTHQFYTYRLAAYLLATLLGVTLLSGAYPAFFLSGYRPARVLKGNFSRGSTGNLLRKGLMTFQFVITSGFIIAILIVNKQFQFLKYRDVGFDPKQVMDIRIHDGKTKKSFPFIKQRLLQLKHVEGVTRVSNQPGSHSMEHSMYSNNDVSMEFDEVHIDYDYFKTLGIPLIAGREFSPGYASDSSNVILNETAAKKYHLMDSVGALLSPLADLGTVKLVGIVPDYNQRGADSRIGPVAFFMNGYRPNGLLRDDRDQVLVRMDLQDVEQTVKDIQSIWGQAEPDYPIQYSFLDQQFASYLESTVRLGKLVGIFTLCALLITLIGLFSLAALTAAQRTKEIGIRKVLGADTRSIMVLLNRQFAGLILLANLIAWPLCYIFIHQWLNNYHYRIDVPVRPFLWAMLITFVLCLLIVSLQAWKAAKADPVDALKYE